MTVTECLVKADGRWRRRKERVCVGISSNRRNKVQGTESENNLARSVVNGWGRMVKDEVKKTCRLGLL